MSAVSASQPDGCGASSPLISFAIPSYNSSRFLSQALESVLAQHGVSIEVLVVDDHSTDGSELIARAFAARDPRVRIFQTPCNGGPGAARNIAIDHARGEWLAVLDSDDLLHPKRSQRLIDEATRSGADLIADDLYLFHDDHAQPASLFLDTKFASAPRWIGLDDYYRRSRLYGRHANLGFLKPMFRLEFLRRSALRYDPSLRIAEDDDLVVRSLRAGAKYRLLPEPLYLYRKHSTSISHRLSLDAIDRMRAVGTDLLTQTQSDRLALRELKPRHRALERAWAFTHFLDALKRRDMRRSVALLGSHPSLAVLLRMPIAARLAKLFGKAKPDVHQGLRPPRVLVVSRQRLTGPSNGSSTYLLALAEALRDRGFILDLVQPSRFLFGRTPFYRLSASMAVFDTVAIYRSWRLGTWVICRDPKVYIGAARGIVSRVLRRLGIRGTLVADRPAPYSVAAPWSRDERLFVAQQAGPLSSALLLDYMFQVEALPYLPHGLPSAIVMHDLFHTRVEQFQNDTDSIARITAAEEIDLLSQANAIIAIQGEEARFLDKAVPSSKNMVFPMPFRAVAHASAGVSDRLLFVGSKTAPNVLGLRWFFDTVWPLVRAKQPNMRLQIAGTVCTEFDNVPEGVDRLGFVNSLPSVYAEAGIVISPLRQGSGLKVKLIEALAHGKACVASPVTLQGVEWLADNAVVLADAPDDFAAAILSLNAKANQREALGTAALRAARQHFSGESEAAAIVNWLSFAIAMRAHSRSASSEETERQEEAAPAIFLQSQD